ncbi:uncharacterized protein LOC131448895 [Solea solea]|uniref:uncharacterized protein LOC131448895 n=1 Tax=Solea solea TaxID=90069 RepID=UPI00272AE4D0|nr:uncharacterized protein LOC131448895 [Solea solea]
MANETTMQPSCIPEISEVDENLAPEVTASAETSYVDGYSSVQPSGENNPLSETCTFSTPAHESGKQSQISGLQSALTPILKYLNIGNRRPSLEPLKCENNPRLGLPTVTMVNCQKSNGGLSKHPTSCKDARVCWLDEERLPELTLLDDTCDTTMEITRNASESESTTTTTITNMFSTPHGCIASTKESNSDLPPKLPKHNWSVMLDDRYSKEITLLDMTCDSDQSPGAEISFLKVKKEISQVNDVKHSKPLSELSGVMVAESQGGGLSTTITDSVAQMTEPSKSLEESMKSLEATSAISMCSAGGNNTSKLSEVDLVNDQPLAEDTLGLHPANVTRDMSSCSDMSVQCAASQRSSTSDMQCNTSVKQATSELQAEPVDTSGSVEATEEVLLTSHTLNAEAPQPSLKLGTSMNDTFTVTQLSKLSTTTELNTTDQMSKCPHNNTVDFPPSHISGPKAGCEAPGQASAEVKKTPEMSLALSQSSSDAKESACCEVQNATFDTHSLQKSNGISVSGEAGAATFCLQNNTFDSKQNGTITLSETSSSDNHQNTVDIPAPLKVCPSTIVHEDKPSEANPPEMSQQNVSTTKTVHSIESTFDANPPVEVAPETGSQSVTVLSDTMDHQGIDAENNKANTFNLDDTFDMKSDPLVTSTPMIHCKVFHFNTENMEIKTIGAQKKLYRDGVSQPVAQVPSDVPANIVSDKKTFLMQPAAKSIRPPLKAASQLLKYKPASTLPGKCEPLSSNLPMTRQRNQVEAFKNPAASEAAKGTTGISSCYSLRSTTTGSKQPNYALPRPQLSGIPSATQRTAPGLRPPSARSIAPPSSNADQIRGQTVANPKKHLLTRGEAVPSAKRKKLDAPVPSSGAATSAYDAVNGARNLKQPVTARRTVPARTQSDVAAAPVSAVETSKSCNTSGSAGALKQSAHSYRANLAKPHGHGCVKCVALEEQLKMKSEEIRRLKEELLKYSKEEES